MDRSGGGFQSKRERYFGRKGSSQNVYVFVGESDDSLVMSPPLASPASMAGWSTALFVRTECRLAEDSQEASVSVGWFLQKVYPTGLATQGRYSAVRGERTDGVEAGAVTPLDDDFRCEYHRNTNQAADTGRVGEPGKRGLKFAVMIAQFGAGGQRFTDELAYQPGGPTLSGNGNNLLGSNGKDAISRPFVVRYAAGGLQVTQQPLPPAVASRIGHDKLGCRGGGLLALRSNQAFKHRKKLKSRSRPGGWCRVCISRMSWH